MIINVILIFLSFYGDVKVECPGRARKSWTHKILLVSLHVTSGSIESGDPNLDERGVGITTSAGRQEEE